VLDPEFKHQYHQKNKKEGAIKNPENIVLQTTQEQQELQLHEL
jgi:hypothetical protein